MQGAGSAMISRRESETFRLQVSFAIPESQLFAWFEQAEPGERVVYCQGYVPLQEDAAWKLAGAWASEGLVHLITRKEGARTMWMAERRPIGTAPVRSVKRSASEDLVQVQLRALLVLLRDAAAAGLRCPTKTAMARAVTGQTDQRALNRVTYLRKRLEGEGKIAVVAGTHDRAPVVTILARGKGCGCSTKGEG